jgi:ABC-type Fe3+ transport system substrate-binding protein
VFFTRVAILKGALHLNAAKLFVSWFLSKDWHIAMGMYSSRTDAPPLAGLDPLSCDYRVCPPDTLPAEGSKYTQ